VYGRSAVAAAERWSAAGAVDDVIDALDHVARRRSAGRRGGDGHREREEDERSFHGGHANCPGDHDARVTVPKHNVPFAR